MTINATDDDLATNAAAQAAWLYGNPKPCPDCGYEHGNLEDCLLPDEQDHRDGK